MTIIRDYSSTINAIKNCIGKTVFGLAYGMYYFNDETDDECSCNLEISFSDNSYLTLMGLGDGESIKADNHKGITFNTFNVTEYDVLSWKWTDLMNEKEWQMLIGQKLQKVDLVCNKYQDGEKRLSACVLYFDNDFVTYYEIGFDTTRFHLNKKLPDNKGESEIEIINVTVKN